MRKQGFLKALGVVVLLVLGLHVTATLVLKYRVESAIARIRAAGDPVTMADLGGPPIPTSEDGAVLYEQAFQRIQARLGLADVEDLPTMISGKTLQVPGAWDEARRKLAQIGDALALARQASEKPRCRFTVNSGAELTVRYLSRAATARAVLALRDCRMDDAVSDFKLALAMSESLKHGSIIGDQLLRQHMISVVCDDLSSSSNVDRLDLNTARQLAVSMSRIDLASGWAEAVKGERAIRLDRFQMADRTRGVGDLSNPPFISPTTSSKWSRMRTRILLRPVLYWDELDCMNRLEQAIHLSDKPLREVEKTDLITRISSPLFQVTAAMFPLYSRCLESREYCTAQLAGTRILLGLIAYKNAYGSYPRSLSELRDQLHWITPEDPFSGKAFIYEPKGNGFVLYSFGLNMKDDGGKPRTGDDFKTGDIVWKR